MPLYSRIYSSLLYVAIRFSLLNEYVPEMLTRGPVLLTLAPASVKAVCIARALVESSVKSIPRNILTFRVALLQLTVTVSSIWNEFEAMRTLLSLKSIS